MAIKRTSRLLPSTTIPPPPLPPRFSGEDVVASLRGRPPPLRHRRGPPPLLRRHPRPRRQRLGPERILPPCLPPFDPSTLSFLSIWSDLCCYLYWSVVVIADLMVVRILVVYSDLLIVVWFFFFLVILVSDGSVGMGSWRWLLGLGFL